MIIYLCAFLWWSGTTSGAIIAPPWANPTLNPCALLPRGWQMLYWPADGRCYKIFKMGHPCPATMELTPAKIGSNVAAECRCPPGTIRSQSSKICHTIFTKGPCLDGEYFAPNSSNTTVSRIGACTKPMACPDPTQIFWPADGRCYRKLGKGPCPPGKLLISGSDGLANCTCDDATGHIWDRDNRCYEHYTRGPCPAGHLFLPGGRCGCTSDLPHYHNNTKFCYEIGSIGPCNIGHRFLLSTELPDRAQCKCKSNYGLWTDKACYRFYTKGPCSSNELFAPPSRCLPLPCRRSRLYFPEEKRCYKIGSQGPCKFNQVVLFDFEARPSIDGIAYNGVCGCAGALSIDKPDNCLSTNMADANCEQTPGMVVINGMCYMLYTKGPCKDGQWLLPKRNANDSDSTKAECACKPGFAAHSNDNGKGPNVKEGICLPPTVTLAKYLNEKYNRSR